MRIALVQPPPRSEFDRHWARFPSLGIAYIAGSLRAVGHSIDLLDGKLAGLTVDDIVTRVRESRPDLVGITCMTVEFPRAVEIARRIKHDRPDVPVVVGGAHVNAVGRQALEEGAGFDYACVGEGEYLARELADALEHGLDPASIPGLVSRQGGELVTAPPRPPPADYDALPFPAWDLFRPVDTLPLITHRGCPFRCVFCSHNSGFKPRYRTPANVLDEIDQILERYRPTRIRIEDETFGLHMGRTKQILEGIIERGVHHRVTFSAQTRVDRADEEFMRLLKTANFETLELGVESGNAEVLRKVEKGITLEQVEYAVALAKANDLRVWCKFILGHPDETHATIRDTIDFIAKLNPHQLSVSIMTPVPRHADPRDGAARRGRLSPAQRRLGGLRQVLERGARARDGEPRPAQAPPDRVLREPLRPQPPLPRARAAGGVASRGRLGDAPVGDRQDGGGGPSACPPPSPTPAARRRGDSCRAS